MKRALPFLLLPLLAACADEQQPLAPAAAEVTYDISYSEDLRKNPTFGDILPRTIYSVYDSANVKFTLRGPLGLGGADIVLSHEEDFVSLVIEDLKLLLTMGDFYDEPRDGQRLTDGLLFTPVEGETDIEGYRSRMVSISARDHEDDDLVIDVFYVPSQAQRADTAQLNLHTMVLLTAVNIKKDETAIMIVINRLKPLEGVAQEEFQRPAGFLQTNRRDLEDIIALAILAQKDQE